MVLVWVSLSFLCRCEYLLGSALFFFFLFSFFYYLLVREWGLCTAIPRPPEPGGGPKVCARPPTPILRAVDRRATERVEAKIVESDPDYSGVIAFLVVSSRYFVFFSFLLGFYVCFRRFVIGFCRVFFGVAVLLGGFVGCFSSVRCFFIVFVSYV